MQARENRDGFILLEWCIYCTLLILLIGLLPLSYSHIYDEEKRFEEVSRHFHSTMKRVQMATLYGYTNHRIRKNQLYVTEHSYSSDSYVSDGKLSKERVIHVLPEHMYIRVSGRFVGGFDFDETTGRGEPFRISLYDKKIRKKREYIFSRQTGRIRWEEHAF